MNEITTLPLRSLKVDPANARRTEAAPSEELLASIKAKGVLVPLIARPNGDGYLVPAGGRRLRALFLLAEDGAEAKGVKVTGDYAVPVRVMDIDANDAREISLAENEIREQMHPVDRYECFAEQIEAGKSEAALREEFLLTPRQVRQIMALGKLAPAIRKAWREEEIDAEAAEAFTLEPDQKRQVEIFNSLKKRRSLNRYSIRSAIATSDRESTGLLRFVGAEDYKAAGGDIKEDLFTEDKSGVFVPADLKLLKKLAEAKVAKKVEELEAEGWKWVARREDNLNGWNMWSHTGKDKADKAKSGVLLGFDYNGNFEIKYGVQKPGDTAKVKPKAAKKDNGGEAAAPEPTISQNMQNDLTRHLNGAVQIAVAKDFDLAFPLLLTTLYLSVTEHGDDCLHISASARLDEKDPTTQEPVLGSIEAAKMLDRFEKKIPREFHKALPVIAKMNAKERQSLCAALVGSTIDVTNYYIQSKGIDPEARDAVICFVDPDIGAGWNATAKSLFNHVPKAIAIQSIKDCAPMSADVDKAGVAKKVDAAAIAERVVKGKGWLPEPLRVEGLYDGPGAKKAYGKKNAR